MSDANALKDQGNKAFAAKNWDGAIDLFSQAIAIDASNHVLFSNRSAAQAGKKAWGPALEDAEQCIKINPTWAKGYARKGAALHGAQKYDDAIAAYEAGLKIEDSAALRKGLKEVQDASDASDMAGMGGADMGMGKFFSDPNLFGKLAANPRTAKHLADPSFVQKIQFAAKNPAYANNILSDRDSRMIDVLGVALGIDMQGFSRPEGSEETPAGFPGASAFPTESKAPTSPPPQAQSPPPAAAKPAAAPTPAPAPAPAASSSKVEEAEDEPMEEAADDENEKKAAEAEKKLGSEAYKKKDFGAAATHFQKAWDTWPKDITFLSNLGAVYFEMGDYDKCIETCEKAVEEGRSIRADYKLVAKALGRIGTAYSKKNDLVSAIKWYNKSLTEHRTPDVLNKLREAEKTKAEADKKAYIDPEKSAAAREEGNALFKGGDFAGAVKSYTESIKRDPSDPRGYNNRANAYTKLAALPEALKDADEAVKVDPAFIKGYLRKAQVLFTMREYTKAMEACDQAETQDTEKKHGKEIQAQVYKIQQALYDQRSGESQEETLERAMKDPEVAQIMQDPIMQSILQQAQTNPASLQDHMKNPMIQQKITKLINAGIIRTR